MRLPLALAALCLAPSLALGSPAPRPCHAEVGADVRCFTARDANGAHVLIARPERWNGALVVHIHGGPRLAPPAPNTSDEDLVRFAETVREGYAWVATSRRRQGFGATNGAEDADNARRLYIDAFGRPRITLVHGQSWGGAVAAMLIERFNEPGADGRRPYDGALLTAGVLAGGTRAYDMRMDLRAVFQAVCGTHPPPGEPAYHLGLGLPPGTSLPQAELRNRFNACTGANRPAAERSPEQARAMAELSATTGIAPDSLFGALTWATYLFQDIATHLTEGRPAFGNVGVRYRGTQDDDAFNARVPRFAADPAAVARLAADSNPTGRIAIPVLSMHAIRDETAFVEGQRVYRDTVAAAGNAARLVQVFTDEHEHSKISPPHYPALFEALRRWVEDGVRPEVAALAQLCEEARARHPGQCRFLPGFEPQPWTARVLPRGG